MIREPRFRMWQKWYDGERPRRQDGRVVQDPPPLIAELELLDEIFPSRLPSFPLKIAGPAAKPRFDQRRWLEPPLEFHSEDLEGFPTDLSSRNRGIHHVRRSLDSVSDSVPMLDQDLPPEAWFDSEVDYKTRRLKPRERPRAKRKGRRK
tara:strand:+ start:121 stop:567 length:447 start_codon:yes stop_codon:yes gene_type:complete